MDSPWLPFHQSRSPRHRRAGEPLAVGQFERRRVQEKSQHLRQVGTFNWPPAGARLGRCQSPRSRFARRRNAQVATCPTSLVRNNSAYQLFRKASCANLAREGRAASCWRRGDLAGWQKTATFRRCPGVRDAIRHGWGPGRRLGRSCCPSLWCSRSLACWTPSGQRHHRTTAPAGPSGQPSTTQILLRDQHRCPGGCRARAPCGSRPRR